MAAAAFSASAVALWATMKLLPLQKESEFSQRLDNSINAAQWLYERLSESTFFEPIIQPELDIVVWFPKGLKSSEITKRSQQIFSNSENQHLYLALYSFPCELFASLFPDIEIDTKDVVCLRSSLMKPEHFDWKEKIWDIIQKSAY